MQFPLGIICDLLREEGLDVVREPHRPDASFSWISAIPDAVASPDQSLVYVVSNVLDAPADAFRIVAKPERRMPVPVPDDQPNDIYVRTDLPTSRIADMVQRKLIEIIQWNDQMTALLEKGCITQDLLRMSQPVLQNYIGLSDATFSYIAHTPNIPPFDEISRSFVEHQYYSLEFIERLRKAGELRKWNFQDWTVVHQHNEHFGHPTAEKVFQRHGNFAALLIMVSPTHINAKTVFLFNLLANKIDLCLDRHWRLENPLEQKYTYFMKRVLSGNTFNESELEDEAKIHGLPTSGLFRLLIVDNTWKVGSPDYFAKMVIDRLPDCKVAIEGGRVAILLCSSTANTGRVASMEDELFKLAVQMKVEIGVSEKFEKLGQAAIELEKARIALNYGHRYSTRYSSLEESEKYTNCVFKYKRYFPYFATDPFAEKEKLTTLLLKESNPLVKLRTLDRERNTNDLEILRVYLRLDGRIGEMCNLLHIHRNTITYRLEKIRKAIGARLDDPDTKMYLRILFLMYE